MIIPLEQLIEFSGNSYELTVAISKRAHQLTILKPQEIEKNGSKVVSLAAVQVYTKQVNYEATS